ncbi:hypothetical protein SPV_2557 [Streptococcus pneumoniae]|nr:hypothetical protein SPV_2557 [Streptococcus pneumoniae]
MTLFRCLTLL